MEGGNKLHNRAETAVKKLFSGYNCAQAVLFSFSNDLDIDKNTALKIACGFGFGIGRRQEACGAIAGGVIAIGAKYGRGETDEKTSAELTYEKTRILLDKFRSKHGTCNCLELLKGCNLMTDKGKQYYKKHNLKETVCQECVKSVVHILDEIL